MEQYSPAVVYDRLSANERLILELLKNDSSTAERIVRRESVDPTVISTLAERHKVSPLVMQRMSRLTLPATLRDDVTTLAHGLSVIATAFNMEARRELRIVVRVLSEAGVDSLLMKGLAVSKDPRRRFNDLDVLIREPDLSRASAALEAAGYRYRGSNVLNRREKLTPFDSSEWNNQFPYQSPRSRLCVEIHTNLFERDRIRLESLGSILDNVDMFWTDRSWDDELGCHVPTHERTLALICVHSALKRSPAHNTYILRHAYDIAQLLSDGIDRNAFLHLCGAWSIEYFACVSLRLADALLDVPAAAHLVRHLRGALTKRQARLAEIHLRCFRGLGDASLTQRLRYALSMPLAIGGGRRKSLRWYRQLVVPPRWQQETRHGVPRDSIAIIFTYFYGPFIRLIRAWRRKD
jgi:hypothetical protein